MVEDLLEYCVPILGSLRSGRVSMLATPRLVLLGRMLTPMILSLRALTKTTKLLQCLRLVLGLHMTQSLVLLSDFANRRDWTNLTAVMILETTVL